MNVPLEIYSEERKAEFLLSNVVDDEDLQRARGEVWKLGLDPSFIINRLLGDR